MSKKKCILLVEDEQDTLQGMLSAIVTKRPDQYDPIVAVDGYEALDFMIEKHIDLVVLDLNMSNLNGLEVCLHMAGDEELSQIPVIISSAHLDVSMIEQLESLGVRHFLRKPYKVDQLIENIDSLMMCSTH